MEKVFEDGGVKKEMVELNQEQLQQGKESDGSLTGNYSTTSVEKYGKPNGPITLYQTGEFYDSMQSVAEKDQAVIEANTIKEVDDYKDQGLTIDLLDRFPKALGLDEESVSEIRDTALPIIQQEVRQAFAR